MLELRINFIIDFLDSADEQSSFERPFPGQPPSDGPLLPYFLDFPQSLPDISFISHLALFITLSMFSLPRLLPLPLGIIQPSLDICCRISIEIRSGMGTNKICGELSLTLSKASWKILAIKMLQSYMRHFVDQGVKDILIFSWYFHDDNLLAFSTVCSVFPGTIEDCVPFHGFFRICK